MLCLVWQKLKSWVAADSSFVFILLQRLQALTGRRFTAILAGLEVNLGKRLLRILQIFTQLFLKTSDVIQRLIVKIELKSIKENIKLKFRVS